MRQTRDRNKVYDHETLRDEREYGFYWYSGLWNLLRPVLVCLGALLIVFGVISGFIISFTTKVATNTVARWFGVAGLAID